MKKLIFKILFFGASVFLFCACPPARQTYEKFYVEQEVKDYCLFNEGSYWIYEDSVTNIIDSVVLINVKHDFEEISDFDEIHIKDYEYYSLKFQWYKEDTVFITYGGIRGLFYSGDYMVYDSLIDIYIINKYYEIVCNFDHKYAEDEKFFEKYTIGEHTFENVIKFGYTMGTPPPSLMDLYLCT